MIIYNMAISKNAVITYSYITECSKNYEITNIE